MEVEVEVEVEVEAEAEAEAEEEEVEAVGNPLDGALSLHLHNKPTTDYTEYPQTPSLEVTPRSRTSSLNGSNIGASIITTH